MTGILIHDQRPENDAAQTSMYDSMTVVKYVLGSSRLVLNMFDPHIIGLKTSQISVPLVQSLCYLSLGVPRICAHAMLMAFFAHG